MGRMNLRAFLFAALFFVSQAFPGPAGAEITIGQKMPPISGSNLTGETVSLEERYKDTVVVLAFWSIYCKPCVAEISSLIKLQDRYRGKVTVIGVATDGELPPARVRTFIERYERFEDKKINYQIIFDEHNQITKMLGVGYLPTVLAIDHTGTVINSFVGFEEKDEAEIFQGVERLLPMAAGQPAPADETTTFEVEAQVPACGFYDEEGWKESFYGNKELAKEIDRVAAVARELALKSAFRKALEKLGVTLCENERPADCLETYGVFLQEDPWKERDCLTNLLNAISYRKYAEVLETSERWLGTTYYVRQKINVRLAMFKEALEAINFSLKPISISFAVINMGKVDRMRFEDAILTQSKYIGKTSFPAYTIYTTQANFISELEKMDFGGSRIFISDAGSGVIEAEVWR